MSGLLRMNLNNLIGRGCQLYNRFLYSLQQDNGEMVVFNTSLETDNLGDCIIMQYCREALHSLFSNRELIEISTHRVPSAEEEKSVRDTKLKFVCGTNLLTSYVEQWWNWRLPDGFRKKLAYRNVILLGVGWNAYQDECSNYSKLIYRSILNASVLHSVRDQYTEQMMKQAGVTNVINTGCPTMWKLTPEFCRDIPRDKAADVITTITDYRRDISNDNLMLEILSRNYQNVYLWLQGRHDEEYLRLLNKPDNLSIIPRSLEAYRAKLIQGKVDYVGTRLHAGIYALNHKVRSCVIAVDNRATEIGKDTNLPLVMRENIKMELEQKIKRVFSTEIRINEANIRTFMEQFK